MTDEVSKAQLLRDSPFYFINKVFGFRVDGCHQEMLQFFIDTQDGMLLCPRGHGKSKIAQGYVGWLALHNPNMRIIIVSDSDSKATMFLTTIKNVLEYSPIIKEYYGDVKGPTWTDHAIVIKGRTKIQTEPTVMSVGSGSGRVTGMHASLLLLDDVESFDSARSEVKRERLQDWYKTTLAPVLMGDGKTMVCGTRYAAMDIYNMLEEDFNFKKLILPAIRNGKALCEWLAPLHDKKLPNGKIIKGLDTIKGNLGSVIYALQYDNDVSLLKAGTVFKYADFQFYKRVLFDGPKVYVERLDGVKELTERIVIGIDPAISEKQVATADYTAMIILGKCNKSGNIYALDYINRRLGFNDNIELIEHMVEKWTPNEVAIEDVAFQKALITELQRRGGLKIKSITPTRDKVARAYMVSGMVESHLVHFKHEGQSIITDDMTFFPDGKHDDLTDAMVYALGQMKIGSPEPILMTF